MEPRPHQARGAGQAGAVSTRRAKRAAGALGLLLLQACSPGAAPDTTPAPVRVVGHRGASGLAPENSLPALDRARTAGAREVEVDVRMSREGVLVLFHDSRLERKTQLEGAVSTHDWGTLRQAEIGRWFHRDHPNARPRYEGTPLATLDEALARHGDEFRWHLELKSNEETLAKAVLDAVDRAEIRERVIASSFLTAQLLAMRELAPSLPLCLNVPRSANRAPEEPSPRRRLSPDEGIDRAIEAGFAMVALALEDLTEDRVRHAHDHGIEVLAYRVRNDDDLERVVTLGVDAAAVPYPGRALAFLASRRAAGGP